MKVTNNTKSDINEDEKIGKWLLKTVYSPSLDTLEGLTRTALDRVQPHSFIRIYAEELLRLCKVSKKSQDLYTENYKKWHSNETNMGNIGKRIMPVDKEINEKQWKIDIKAGKIIDYTRYRNKGNENGRIYTDDELKGIEKTLVDTKTDERFKIPSLAQLPCIQYLYHYDMNRRSTIPDVLLKTFDLVGSVMNVGNTDNENQPPKFINRQ